MGVVEGQIAPLFVGRDRTEDGGAEVTTEFVLAECGEDVGVDV